MNERDILVRIDEKLDAMQKDFSDYKLESKDEHYKMAADLQNHMARTEAAELRLDHIEHEVKPLLESAKGIKTVVTFIAFLAGFIGSVIGIWIKLRS